MKKSEDQLNKTLKSISELAATQDLPRATVQDALSIVIDAINSTVGGLIITAKSQNN
jgi:hypothetical protein